MGLAALRARRWPQSACRAPLGAAFFIAILATGAAAKTWTVAPNGSGDRATIQAAVNAAKASDVIELKDGVFAGAGNRDIDAAGKALVIRSKHGVASACVIDCGGTTGVPHRAFIFHSGEGPGSILEAVQIRNGMAWDEGGAVRCLAASPTLRRVEILNSQAGFGGGLACLDGATPAVEGCTFAGNRSDFGSGAACRNSSPEFTECTFTANQIAEIGGGALCEAGSHPAFVRCLFDGNHAEIGAGLACRDGSDPLLSACEFIHNAADGGGGEGGGAWCANSAPTFQSCIFTANSAVGHGGALACAIASPHLAGCTLYSNQAPRGGGIYSWLDSAPTIVTTIIAFSPDGEAVACESGGTALLACTDVFANAGGDWIGLIAPQLGATGNFTAHPRFCDAAAGRLHLRDDSPCLAGHHPDGGGCELIGALGPGCIEGASADLALRKTLDRPSVRVGENVVFTITLKNLGPSTATGVAFGDPVPDALNFVSFSSDHGTVTGSYCNVDAVAPGDSVVATLIATPITNPAPSERWCQNTAYIAARSTPDPNPANDTACALVYLVEPTTDADPAGAHRLALRCVQAREPGVTRLVFTLPVAEPRAELAIFDVSGHKIAVLVHGAFAAGEHAVDWNHGTEPSPAARGVYLARLRTAAGNVTQKVRLTR